MHILPNPFVADGLTKLDSDIPFPSTDDAKPAEMLKQCPAFQPTPLRDCAELAGIANVSKLFVKDERELFGLGSFKALGAAYVIACDGIAADPDNTASALAGKTYVTASAGNHGMSVAAGAGVFGAKAVVYLAETVPESFARRLAEKGADVVRAGDTYEASMAAARQAADENGWTLLSDSSWPGYLDIPHRLMEGYLQMARETADQLSIRPSHIFLQAGVGGFAGAVAAFARKEWGHEPKIIVVEPEAAPALLESIKAGDAVVADGPVSSMGRLDCKEPSLIGLKGLARDADFFVTVSDRDVEAHLPLLARNDLATSPSGAAGLAALLKSGDHRDELALTDESVVLTFITEGPA